jgi:hypothetical protein
LPIQRKDILRIIAVALSCMGTLETRAATGDERKPLGVGGEGFLSEPVPRQIKSRDRAGNKSLIVGHNVTPTTETLKRGVVTAGNYAVAVGLTDSLFIATSPWIWSSYNTANVHLKWGKAIDRGTRVGLFGSYFQSYNSAPLTSEWNANRTSTTVGNRFGRTTEVTTKYYDSLNRYQWESSSIHALISHDVHPSATVYMNLHYGYFWNDDYAYSIRMDPGNDAIRDQIDVTSLTVIDVGSDGAKLLLETGVLGLNYVDPYLQIGASLAFTSDSWLVQFGASATMQFQEAGYASGWSPGRHDTRLHYSQTAGKYYTGRYLQTAVHPEVQLQYFF